MGISSCPSVFFEARAVGFSQVRVNLAFAKHKKVKSEDDLRDIFVAHGVILAEDFQPKVNQILEAVNKNSKILFLCSPNNPSGNSFSVEKVEELLMKFNGLVVVDEAYIDFSEQKSWLEKLTDYPNLIITQTLSKAYGLAGIRLGVCYASEAVISVLNNIKPPYNVNELTQQKAIERLSNMNEVQSEIAEIINQRTLLIESLKSVSFIDEMNNAIQDVGSEMILGAENAAPGPYIAGLPFNDIRNPYAYGKSVPAAPYVFHQYCNNFMGNQVGSWQEIDCIASPENLQFRLAYGFVRGEMLSLSLRDSGEIDWGVAADWSKPPPKQGPILELVRKLNHLRRTYPKFLADGEMQKAFAQIDCGDYIIKYFYGEESHPALLQSSWLAQDESGAQFVVNFRDQIERALITLSRPCTLLQGETRSNQSGEFDLKMPPLSVAILFFKDTGLTHNLNQKNMNL